MLPLGGAVLQGPMFEDSSDVCRVSLGFFLVVCFFAEGCIVGLVCISILVSRQLALLSGQVCQQQIM